MFNLEDVLIYSSKFEILRFKFPSMKAILENIEQCLFDVRKWYYIIEICWSEQMLSIPVIFDVLSTWGIIWWTSEGSLPQCNPLSLNIFTAIRALQLHELKWCLKVWFGYDRPRCSSKGYQTQGASCK